MAGFSNVSPATRPTRPAKKDPLGTFLNFKSSRVSLLKRQSSEGSRYQTTCISKHYELNHQVYEAFRIHYYNLSSVLDTGDDKNKSSSNNNHNNNKIKDKAKSNFEWISSAFCLGWNFVETALLDLPTHGYFYSNGDAQIIKLRKRSSVVALEVTRLLLRILKLMDSLSDDLLLLDSSGMSSSNNNNNNNNDPNVLWLLKGNRNECKRKLATLKHLAKEQCEHLDTYEAKRLSVVAKWKPPPDPEGSYHHLLLSSSSTHNNNHHKNSTIVVVGNNHHRALDKNSSRRDPSSSSSESRLPLDCETMGETFMACSRILCPMDDPAQEVPATVSVPTKKSAPKNHHHHQQARDASSRRSLVDKLVDKEDSGSDCAVLEETFRPSGNNNNNINNKLSIRTNKSDDAIFDTPTKSSSSSERMKAPKIKAPPKIQGTKIESSSGRQGVPSPDWSTTSTTTSRRRKTPNSKKKQNNKSSDAKKGVTKYANKLFGKKNNNALHQQQRRRNFEETEFQEALYLSELEAAKAASMREEETKEILQQCYSDYSSCDGSSGIHPPDLNDFELQQALYLSELEAACQQSSFEAAQEEERRDDSGGEGRQHERTKTATAQVVVKGVPVAARGPPGAIYRCRNDPYDSLKVVKACCRKDFERLREQKKVIVTRIPTYQGRILGSTNGCTVIAPLLCAHYFETQQQNKSSQSVRLCDERITSVIDNECPSLLPDIRKSLGVSKNAFLIPHDAHEHLIESKHMSRDQFVTVCGGNILEEGHLGALIKELSTVLPDGKRLGATFFFHQHVIAILQLRNSKQDKTSLSFDIIDSLPNKVTLPLSSASPISDKMSEKLLPQPPNCARIFCKDALSLKATLKWYACSVFTPENERYIDDYHWDEKLTDFDPRVFQAFVWKEI